MPSEGRGREFEFRRVRQVFQVVTPQHCTTPVNVRKMPAQRHSGCTAMSGGYVPYDPKAAKRALAEAAVPGDVVERTNRVHALAMVGDRILVINTTVSGDYPICTDSGFINSFFLASR